MNQTEKGNRMKVLLPAAVLLLGLSSPGLAAPGSPDVSRSFTPRLNNSIILAKNDRNRHTAATIMDIAIGAGTEGGIVVTVLRMAGAAIIAGLGTGAPAAA
jgi:hypothetical protein